MEKRKYYPCGSLAKATKTPDQTLAARRFEHLPIGLTTVDQICRLFVKTRFYVIFFGLAATTGCMPYARSYIPAFIKAQQILPMFGGIPDIVNPEQPHQRQPTAGNFRGNFPARRRECKSRREDDPEGLRGKRLEVAAVQNPPKEVVQLRREDVRLRKTEMEEQLEDGAEGMVGQGFCRVL
jgi:hypothetical protein